MIGAIRYRSGGRKEFKGVTCYMHSVDLYIICSSFTIGVGVVLLWVKVLAIL